MSGRPRVGSCLLSVALALPLGLAGCRSGESDPTPPPPNPGTGNTGQTGKAVVPPGVDAPGTSGANDAGGKGLEGRPR